ncbi:unnamed protein product [Phytomonas sp. Hart1]|nr:unnamed protein product [Phytomonas sp. Hart1]|eukprot:CCW70701.1 unnamed protein product [Phytomonas sp. isolate Hart1]
MKAGEGGAVVLCSNNSEEAAAESPRSLCAAHIESATPTQSTKSGFQKGEEEILTSLPLGSVWSSVLGSHCIVNISLSEVPHNEPSDVCFEDNSAEKLIPSNKPMRMNEEKVIETIAWAPTMFTKSAGRSICILEERLIRKDSSYDLFLFSNSSTGSKTRETLLLNAQNSTPWNGSSPSEVEPSLCYNPMGPNPDHKEGQDRVRCVQRPSWRFRARTAAVPHEDFYLF